MSAASNTIKSRLFVVAGTIFIGIGVIGIILPVLPTTPFLLLAAACYMRGSQRLYNALLNNRFTGSYICNYLEGRGMPLKMKIRTIIFLWIAVVGTAVLAINSESLRIILAVVLIGVTIHIIKMKTLKEERL